MPEVLVEEARRFMEDSLTAVGAPVSEAKAQADLLIHADTVGHYSHGLNRLEFYINDILSKATDPCAKPVILKESAATALVDGCDALGATVGNFCMDVAIRKAKEAGVGWVAARRSNHYGMAGYWALKAEKQGLIGLSFTNSSPILVPTRSKTSALGTNPIALAAPAKNGDNLVVDLATTAVAMGKVEIQVHKEEPLPAGWALGPDGKTTTDAKLAFETAKLLPLGGAEETSGYKGYALSALVEVLCSGLSGSKSTHQVRGWELDSQGGPPDLGHCFAAIDPGCFAPGFEDRISNCLQHWRNLEPMDPKLPVLAPGDKERKNYAETQKRGTINYPQKQYEAYFKMANRIGIKPMQIV
ncbi:uncharacterized protein LOC114253309 isoform X2 [Bombyx mandarina]|uniref:Uncharacterized protein LOC114253309 isoform X1 n=1 Tax=Bombyx mandarina TaxID=7092 RepID=A0A6J2KSJ3_BOMMA|nr:uncharacterized protein LOC114253309 isoform X1 [Bombyx mandarina]XP_028043952.1 uncharacterized protein LOC114253309 isoform X2 [Bombyx mandarina]